MDADQAGPHGGLLPAEIVRLEEAQLDAAVAEIRFSRGAGDPLEGGALLAACRAAALDLPLIEPLHHLEVTIGPAAGAPEPVVERSSGWRLSSADGSFTVTVSPDALVLQSARYRRWREDLGGPLERLLGVLAGLPGAPDLVHRVGLRYINRLSDDGISRADQWSPYVEGAALGLVLHPGVGSLISGTQQQVQLRLEDTVGAIVRHGAFTEVSARGERCGYLVDVDVFDQAAAPFGVDAVTQTARRLNRSALSLFQTIVKPAYRQRLSPTASPRDEETS